MTSNDLSARLRTCEEAARAGGKLLQSWRGRFQTREKAASDFVTDADLASQKAIQQEIAARFPEEAFVGEESSTTDSGDISGWTWIADPLDGTTNYVHNYPNYAVSVAVAKGRDIAAGVIFDPLRDLCYSAATGHGAFCNGERLRVSSTTKIADSLVGISLPARVERNSPDLLDFIEIVQLCQAARRTGSAALNLAHVASGALDAFWATRIHPWDVAAGVLLIREAGGIVTARDGGDFDLWNPHFVSSATQSLQSELLKALTPYRGE